MKKYRIQTKLVYSAVIEEKGIVYFGDIDYSKDSLCFNDLEHHKGEDA